MVAQVVVHAVDRLNAAFLMHEVLDDIQVVVRGVELAQRNQLTSREPHVRQRTHVSLKGLKREDAAQQQEQDATQHDVFGIFAQLRRHTQGTRFAPTGDRAIKQEPCMSLSLRIALISEHASPLAAAGGVDAGGQNIYVAQVARCPASGSSTRTSSCRGGWRIGSREPCACPASSSCARSASESGASAPPPLPGGAQQSLKVPPLGQH